MQQIRVGPQAIVINGNSIANQEKIAYGSSEKSLESHKQVIGPTANFLLMSTNTATDNVVCEQRSYTVLQC